MVDEVNWARRAWAESQALLAGGEGERVARSVEWHDSTFHPETGAFALARIGGPLEDSRGNILRVHYGDRSIYVYVFGTTTGITADLSLARRAFLGLAPLATDELEADVAVVA